MDMLQKQLQEALDDAMKLKEELDQDKEDLYKAAEETDELQQLLTQSAKENMELWNTIEGQEIGVRENNEKMEKMTKEVETLREEKAALADKTNEREAEIKNLQSEMRLMRLHRANSERALGEACELKETNLQQQTTIDEHTKVLEERDAKIKALEDQLKLGPQGDEAQKLLDATAELESIKAQLKQSKLSHSVELSKNEAMATKLQNAIGDKKSGISKCQEKANASVDVLEATKAKLNEALAKLEASKDLNEKVHELECRINDSEMLEAGLQNAIDKWTDKAFDWQEKAETLEAELAQLRGGDVSGGNSRRSSNSIEESINAVFGGLFGQNK
jgi:DNA repair exonuclease SbcCD ATPase subunit